MEKDEIEWVTLADISRRAPASRAAVSNWRKRYDDFPEPDGQVRGSRFDWALIQEFMAQHGLPRTVHNKSHDPRQYVLFVNGTAHGDMLESRSHARLALIQHLLRCDNWELAEQVLMSAAIDTVEMPGAVWEIRLISSRRNGIRATPSDVNAGQ